MEYFIGVVTGIILVSFLIVLIKRGSSKMATLKPLTQSFVVNVIMQVANMYEEDEDYEEDEEHEEKTKVVFAGNEAYWIDNGKFFVAESDGDSVFTSTKREVDTMSMSHVELNRLMKIVEALRSNDEDRD